MRPIVIWGTVPVGRIRWRWQEGAAPRRGWGAGSVLVVIHVAHSCSSSPGNILDKVLGRFVWDTAFLLCCQISKGYREKTRKFSSSSSSALFHGFFTVVKKVVLMECSGVGFFPHSNSEVPKSIPYLSVVMELFLFSKTIARKVLE